MVRRIFKIFHKEFGGLHEAAYLLGIFALLSQVLGLVRDRLLAHSFGASQALDLYYAAFRIPDFIFVSVASFASATVIVPFFIERKNRSDADAKKFLNDIFTVFCGVMTIVSALVFVMMPVLSELVVPGFSKADQAELVFLSRVLLLSPFLLGLSNFIGSVTQSVNKFFVFAFSPVLYNLGIIIGILLWAPIFGITGVVAGVVLGALLHLAIQLPVVAREGFLPKLSHAVNFANIKQVVFLSLPRTLALSVGNISVLILITFASLVSEGSISIFQFSFNLQSVPLSIIGVSYSVAAFPTLSRLFAQGEKQKFVAQVANAAKHIIFWSLPVVFLFIVLRAQIVRVILGSGKFNWDDTRLTAAGLAIFTVSLVAQSLVLLFTRGYYAAGKTRKPLSINVISSALIIILAFFFMRTVGVGGDIKLFLDSILKVDDIAGTSVLLLPFAYTFGTIVNAALLWVYFQRDFGGFTKEVSRAFWESLSASFVMGVVSYNFLQVFASVFDLDTFIGIFLQGFLSGILGIIAGVIVLVLLKNPEFETVSRAMRHKFWKASPVSPGQEEI